MAETAAPPARGGSVFLPFVLDTRNGDRDFVRLVTSALNRFDPKELPKYHQTYWSWVCQLGAEEARIRFNRVLVDAVAENPDRSDIPLADISLDCGIGDLVFRMIPESEHRRFLPVNDVEFHAVGKALKVTFRSLQKRRTARGTTFYSRYEREVRFDNRDYVVGFSKHAIDRLCERINPHWMRYDGLGDVFAYFDKCVHFQPCRLADGSPAFTFWDEIGDRRFWHYRYVEHVLGVANHSPTGGRTLLPGGLLPGGVRGEVRQSDDVALPRLLEDTGGSGAPAKQVAG
jgi:hypothetical protein